MSKQQTNLTQSNCEVHRKQANGVCTEDICKYQSRILCSDCQFSHQKCNQRMEIKQFQAELQYILNPEMHKANCHYFPDNSKLIKLVDESFEKAKTKFKQHILNLEQKELAFLLSEQGLILNSNQSNRWAQQLLNLKNMNLSKQEYDSAVTMLREKQEFDKTVFTEIKSMFEKFNQMNKIVLEQILKNFRLQNQHYDVQQLYDDANKTLNKSKGESILDIEDKIKQQRFKVLSGGHETEAAIVAITESPTHLISGSNTGNIVGWFKPSFHLDFRIKASEGLSSLAVAKMQDQHLLFAGGAGVIQAFSLQNKLKMFNLTGHTQPITRLQAYSLRNLISSSQDGALKIWDLKERKQIKSFQAHSGPLSDFVLTNELVTVGQDGQINFIDVGSQTVKKTTQVQVPIFCIGAIKQGKYALGMGDGSVKILKGTKTRDFKVSDEVIYRVLPLNSKQLVCYSADGNLCVLNLKKSSKIFKCPIQKEGQWQDLAFIDQQLLVPNYGSIRVYQK